jgi:transcriptional regulator with XRE-family HTH domain
VSAPRYKEARERAGLSLGQAVLALGPAIVGIESGELSPGHEDHEMLARAYGVTPCWLAGHDPSPDLTDLARQAEDKNVSEADWREIATFAASMVTCDACKAETRLDVEWRLDVLREVLLDQVATPGSWVDLSRWAAALTPGRATLGSGLVVRALETMSAGGPVPKTEATAWAVLDEVRSALARLHS